RRVVHLERARGSSHRPRPGQPRRAITSPLAVGHWPNSKARNYGRQHKEADMGLADVLTGMMNGPRGQRQPSSGGGGMSPIMMALHGLLAHNAFHWPGGHAATSSRIG